jgi:hypothetical protein
MVKQALAFTVLMGFFLTSCSDNKKVQDPEIENVEEVTAVGTNDELVGRWAEPNPINAQEVQGIEMMEDGTAKSINMATLLYSKWWIKDQQLFLVEESLGSGGSTVDTATYEIIKVDKDSLVLKNNNQTIRYKKQ